MERRRLMAWCKKCGSSVWTNNTVSFLYLEFVLGPLVGFVDVSVCRKLAVQLSQGQSGVTTGVGLENNLVKEIVLHLLTYNNTLIYGHDCCRPLVWPRKDVCTESVDIQQDTDLRSRWCRPLDTLSLTWLADRLSSSSLSRTKCDTGFKNLYRDYRRLTSWMNLFHTCWHATKHWSMVMTDVDLLNDLVKHLVLHCTCSRKMATCTALVHIKQLYYDHDLETLGSFHKEICMA